MFGQTLAIIRNTFFEAIRQPIMLVILGVASIALVFSNLLAGFTMEDDQRMMIDLGLSTVFISGTLLAAFIATNVLNREIENKTALTVISKPVSRPLFVVGKFLGVALALGLATAYMSFIFMLVELHEVRQTVRDPYHKPVLVFGPLAVVLGVGIGVWANYFYGKVFSSTVIALTTPLVGLAYFFALMFDTDFNLQPIAVTFRLQLWLGLIAILMAILVLTAIAIAASTRLGQVLTLVVTLGVFMLGMLSDWVFGRQIEQMEQVWLGRATERGLTTMVDTTRTIELTTGEIEETSTQQEIATVQLRSLGEPGERIAHTAAWMAYALVPNFQVFWLSDTVTQNRIIPARYMTMTLVYGPVQMMIALSVAVMLFQRREVG